MASPDGEDLFLVSKIKPDERVYQWKRFESLEDLALFVGYNHSLALSARDFPGLNPNSIQFTGDYWGRDLGYGDRRRHADTGVFNLEDESLQFSELNEGREKLVSLATC